MEKYNVNNFLGYRFACGVKSKSDMLKLMGSVDGFNFSKFWGGEPKYLESLSDYSILMIEDLEFFQLNLSRFKGEPEYLGLFGDKLNIDLQNKLFNKAKILDLGDLDLKKSFKITGQPLTNVKKLTLRGKIILTTEIINLFPCVKELHLYNVTINESDLINGCKDLELLTLFNIKSTIDFSLLNLNKLKTLNMESCKKIENYASITKLKKLRTVILDKCKSIPNLQFLEDSSITDIRLIHTTIDSGNLTPLTKLKYARILPSKKSYSHNEKQILALIAENTKQNLDIENGVFLQDDLFE